MDRRQALKRGGAIALLGILPAGAATARRTVASGNAQVIEVLAQRFRFTPNEIALRTGQPAVLAIRSLDFVHGFKVPELGIRTDLMPGTVTRVAIRALSPGRYDFLCDNFCGGGHEEMNGSIVVSD
ncbi:MAG TPA: cupredoxin domain-containing protein [Burkholderiales bacterium]|jgi:cytochrome c oxidase subunit 2|nr:cupredoxin domain-containing protein [Burkholderiales bacterium]